MDEYWNCKIADLGLSRRNEDNAETLTKMRGTYQYTPPESYRKEVPYSAKSDVYSVSIVYWELMMKCLTGDYHYPFKEHNLPMPFQILIKVAKEGIRPTFPPNCPPLLSDMIQSCWQTDPTLRPDAKQLILKIEELSKTFIENKKEWDHLLVWKQKGNKSMESDPSTNEDFSG